MTEALELFFQDYLATLPPDRRQLLARYQMLDVARKVVGVGSVGTRCWVVFMRGVDNDDPLFLQVKEAQESVLAPYVGPSAYANQGHRVVAGQRLIQGAPDIFLGWAEQDGRHYYVRQLRDMKGAFDFTTFDVEDLGEYAVSCAHALAHSMAKAGDPALLAGYMGKSGAFDQAIEQFALAYAEKNEADWAVLKAAIKSGRIQAIRE